MSLPHLLLCSFSPCSCSPFSCLAAVFLRRLSLQCECQSCVVRVVCTQICLRVWVCVCMWVWVCVCVCVRVGGAASTRNVPLDVLISKTQVHTAPQNKAFWVLPLSISALRVREQLMNRFRREHRAAFTCLYLCEDTYWITHSLATYPELNCCN